MAKAAKSIIKERGEATAPHHRTHPIPGTLSTISGYPKTLRIYRLEASPFWWVRFYHKGKIYRRSTRTEIKRDAVTKAKDFFSEIASGRHSKERSGEDASTFAFIAEAMLKSMKAEVARDDLTKQTYDIAEYRLRKTILPSLGDKDINAIHFEDIEELLNQLSHQTPKLSPSTISSYLKLTRRVFSYAFKRRSINVIPHFPSVSGKHQPRGYFTAREYRKMWSRARKLIGSRFEYRKLTDKKGVEQKGSFHIEGKCKEGRLIRKTTITRELMELIVFMTNSYCRPTDIKNLQHKHVEIVRDEHTFLRLKPPETKGHDKPFVTMPMAVEVYERLTKYNKDVGRSVEPDAFVFFPNYLDRDYALKELMRQFAVLMWDLNMGKGPNGEERTIYSLRHTCFMFRLMYGEKIDHVTLARNGRTSPEMIDRYYASQLRGEDNIDMLQSRRRSNKFIKAKSSFA